jgi:lipid II:glycine glycyltransferase (peptidoglycan interpeptide bridge formation enzyme)
MWGKRQIPRLEIRWALPIRGEIQTSVCHVMHVLTLSPDPEHVYKSFKKGHRYNIHKSENNNLTVIQVESRADFEKYYFLHLQTRRRLGVPAQPRKFFNLIWEKIIQPGHGLVSLVLNGQEAVAGAVFLTSNRTIIYKYSASNQKFWASYPNNLLLWNTIQWACKSGYQTFNFGSSEVSNLGLRAFKNGWGAEEQFLSYSYLGIRPPFVPDGVSKKIIKTVISHSPTFVCRLMGEILYKHYG